jgi:exopolyphosphatase / guanosine-5'-triphosphate,3'-diphosphate pyrophosphatase
VTATMARPSERTVSLGGSAGRPLAVLDIGSNTGRIIVVRLTPGGHLETLADAHAPLRLVREVRAKRFLGAAAIDRTMRVLRDFQAVAHGAGAERIVAVATSAVREAANGRDIVGRARRELGLVVQVIDGQREARYAFIGAVQGLPIEHGFVLDLGGGSLQISHFRHRSPRRAWTLPLGALRLSDRFLDHDPPTGKEIRRLKKAVRVALKRAGVRALAGDERLIGTGGTIRNLAKMDRRRRDYPIPRLHGYILSSGRLENVTALLASRRRAKREALPGLNADRADSIVGGALIVETVMEVVGADEIVVAGQGLREGLAFGTAVHAARPAKVVRRAAILALARRFGTWNPKVAARRAGIAARLLAALEPRAASELREMLDYAAMVLDIGQSVDHFKRHEHTALILKAADLAGFSHRELALLSALVWQVADGRMTWKIYRPLLRAEDQELIERAATILALAEEIAQRWVARAPATVQCRPRGREVVLGAPGLGTWAPRRLADRFEHAFGRRLAVETPGRREEFPAARQRRRSAAGRRN